MASLTEWQTLDPSRVERTVTVMVPTEWYVNGKSWSDTTRHYGRAFAGDVRHCHLVVACSSWFCSVACFLGQFARDMDVSVSFSNNQIHEARTQETEKISMPKWKKIHLELLFTDHQVTHIIPGHWDVDRRVLDSVTR